MAERIDIDGLALFKDKQDAFNEGKFAPKGDFETYRAKVDGLETAGGQPNVVETVKVNGTALAVSGKAVDIAVPTDNSQLANGAGYQTASDVAAAVSGKADASGLGSAAAKDAESSLTDGANLPTGAAVKSFVEGKGYQTASQVSAAISAAAAGVMDYKGAKATVAELPSTGNKKGDVWHVSADGSERAWDGSQWQELGTAVDLSGYATKSDVAVATNAQINALFA